MDRVMVWLQAHVNGEMILWGFRVGIILILLGIFWPTKSRRFMLRRLLQIRHDGLRTTKWMDYLEGVAHHPVFRWFALKPDSDEYVKLENLIQRAGGLNGLTPNIVQLMRVLIPPVFFVVAIIGYLVHIRMAYLQYQENLLHPSVTPPDAGNVLFAVTPHVIQMNPPSVSWVAMMWIGVASLILYLAPERIIRHQINRWNKRLVKELHMVEQFLIALLEVKMTVYEILRVLRDTTVVLRPELDTCVNEFYVVGPEKAIQRMSERVQNDEFRAICDVLQQAVVNSNAYTVSFLTQHMNQFEQFQRLEEERKIRMKPFYYTLVLGMPLTGVVVLYFYPFLVRAISMLHSF